MAIEIDHPGRDGTARPKNGMSASGLKLISASVAVSRRSPARSATTVRARTGSAPALSPLLARKHLGQGARKTSDSAAPPSAAAMKPSVGLPVPGRGREPADRADDHHPSTPRLSTPDFSTTSSPIAASMIGTAATISEAISTARLILRASGGSFLDQRNGGSTTCRRRAGRRAACLERPGSRPRAG